MQSFPSGGEETTPDQVIGADGTTVQILSGMEEEHISADVAYAIWHYWRATGDNGFLLDAGAEILFETARFWASRAQPEADGQRHIRDVEGPDEYHGHIDDNAFTNVMAQWNIRRAIEVAALLRERWPERGADIAGRIALDEAELEEWGKAAEALDTAARRVCGWPASLRGAASGRAADNPSAAVPRPTPATVAAISDCDLPPAPA